MTDEEGVRRTLARFCQYLDDRRFAEFSGLFMPDAVFGRASGREAIHELTAGGGLARNPELFRKHLTGNVVVDVQDERAEATSDLVMFERVGDEPWQLRFGVYHDVLVKHGDAWLFASRQLTWTANGLRRN